MLFSQTRSSIKCFKGLCDCYSVGANSQFAKKKSPEPPTSR